MISGRRVTEEESELKNYDPTQDEVVAQIFYRKGNNKNNQPVDPFSSQANPKLKSAQLDENETGIANLEISVPRPMVSLEESPKQL